MKDSKLTLTPPPKAKGGATFVLSGPGETPFPALLGCLGCIVLSL